MLKCCFEIGWCVGGNLCGFYGLTTSMVSDDVNRALPYSMSDDCESKEMGRNCSIANRTSIEILVSDSL